jgi:Zn-dependent protease
MNEFNSLQIFAIFVIPVIFAITVHEAAHGWMAKRLGDSTAEMLGRLTFNPIPHIDPVGTILVPLGLYLFSQVTGGPFFLFGWAKPVPINWNNLNKPKRDIGLVALAGPGANLLMALIWAVAVYIGAMSLEAFRWFGLPLLMMGVAGVLINSLLMVLNLLPVPPLDGGRVVYSLLPAKQAQVYSRIEPYGLFIILILFILGPLKIILWSGVDLMISILPATDIVKAVLH